MYYYLFTFRVFFFSSYSLFSLKYSRDWWLAFWRTGRESIDTCVLFTDLFLAGSYREILVALEFDFSLDFIPPFFFLFLFFFPLIHTLTTLHT